jgi:hypothetical protein
MAGHNPWCALTKRSGPIATRADSTRRIRIVILFGTNQLKQLAEVQSFAHDQEKQQGASPLR